MRNEDLINNNSNVDQMEAELDGMELDDSLLFGDDDDETPTVDGSEGDVANGEQESIQPEVIDTTKEAEAIFQQQQSNAQKAMVKEIDGQLFVALDSSNSQVMGKDGKHQIPYEVLERARNGASGAKQLQNRIVELEGQLKTTSTKQKLFEEQLTEAGLDPEKLPEELLQDPQAIERIKEEYPGEAGQIIAALIDKVQGQGGNVDQQPAQQQSATPVTDVLQAQELQELNSWRDTDADRWEMALIIDNKLNQDPEFSTLPMAERFAEVQRRVKATFGDPVQASIDKELAQQQQKQQQANQPPAAQQQSMPNSPSELGSSPLDTTQANNEALASQDAMTMQANMAQMSDSQLESFLEQAGMAFD